MNFWHFARFQRTPVTGCTAARIVSNWSSPTSIFLSVAISIQENPYMQFFIGFEEFTQDRPFDASLMVARNKHFGVSVWAKRESSG